MGRRFQDRSCTRPPSRRHGGRGGSLLVTTALATCRPDAARSPAERGRRAAGFTSAATTAVFAGAGAFCGACFAGRRGFTAGAATFLPPAATGAFLSGAAFFAVLPSWRAQPWPEAFFAGTAFLARPLGRAAFALVPSGQAPSWRPASSRARPSWRGPSPWRRAWCSWRSWPAWRPSSRTSSLPLDWNPLVPFDGKARCYTLPRRQRQPRPPPSTMP